jgi:toxin-antitoxin system PIN domain toxin
VILVDVNILVYASITTFSEHDVAHEWLDRQINGTGKVGLPWSSLIGFLRVVTNPRIFNRPFSGTLAWGQVNAWLECDTVWTPEPAIRHRELLAPLLMLPGVLGNLVPDAHLAALAIEHGLTLCSTDGDFARFSGLRWINPLQPPK